MVNAAVIDHANLLQQEAANPAVSAWVSASAGSGKTTVLTRRVLALLLAGNDPHRILCLTFTKAAAAQMANRIAQRLSAWVTLDESALQDELSKLTGQTPKRADIDRARRLFATVLDAPGGLRIDTIHAFCQSLLKRFPLEAGVAPNFELLDDTAADEALREAVEQVIVDPSCADAVGVVAGRVHETRFDELLRALVGKRGKIERALASGYDAAASAIDHVLGLAPGTTPESILAGFRGTLSVADLDRACAALGKGSDADIERASCIRTWIADPHAPFADFADIFLTQEGTVRKTLATKGAQKHDAQAAPILSGVAEMLCALRRTLAAAETARHSKALLTVAGKILEKYRAFKTRRSALDYDDLIAYSRRLLERGGAWVLYKLDGGIDHVLIDEAQDTNPDQWAIVEALTGDFFSGVGQRPDVVRTVFGVGDRKQSIFSFQGADPQGFLRMEDNFSRRAGEAGREWAKVELNVSFRSTETVLGAVDAVFAGAARDGVVDTDKLVHMASRTGHAGLVEVWPPIEPEPKDTPEPWKPPVDRVGGQSPQVRLARVVANRIQNMLNSGDRLPSRDRPIRAGDVLVLVRRRTVFVDELIRRLKELDIPVAGVDRMRLTEQLAVMDLMALGRFLLLPEDDLNLAIVLKSPLIGISEDDLFALAHHRGPRSLWRALQESSFTDARTFLSDLLAKTDYLGPYALYAHVLAARDGRRKILGRLGPEADDPINEFLNLALDYQRNNAASLQGFLAWLERAAPEIKRDLEQASLGAVRIMTCHGAKGLEAPVVFLPDTVQTPTVRDSIFWDETGGRPVLIWKAPHTETDTRTVELRDAEQARQDQEYRRLLYVAMTRAQDRLYVCGWNTQKAPKTGNWHELISGALTDYAETVEEEFIAGSVLRITRPQTSPAEAEDTRGAAAAVPSLPAWASALPGPEPEPPRPLAPSRPSQQDPPMLSPLGEDRSRRFQRGLLIHRLLQILPDLAMGERRAVAERLAARPAWSLDAATQAQAIDETLRVIAAPEFAAVFAPGSRAEVPVTGAVGSFRLSGQVDRLAVTDSDVLIVDYKTNRPPPPDVAGVDPAYLFQMAAYRAALRAIWPDRRVRCLLLWTDGPRLMELPDAALDQAFAAR